PSSQAPDRADAHDGAAALTAQQWKGALAAQEHAREHDIDLHPPVAFGHLLRWTDQGKARVVHQDVQPAKVTADGLERRRHVAAAPDVGPVRPDLPPGLAT